MAMWPVKDRNGDQNPISR
jgi:hypothetical protein